MQNLALLANLKSTRRILYIAHEKGRRHDLKLFKTSRVRLHHETKAVARSGYQGLQRVHANTAMPEKRGEKKPLSATDKIRNRRRRFGLRFFLIAAIYKMELKTA
ncbi:MAG: hypothetical protein L0Y50_13180 [Beijerinckiaceae bacterium]|nr:hypothetical protein [Beijerinckiaceae bacterium]MCI0737201.1 hypothetical protein [Beijerinckiaceae bacterium]